MPSQVSVETVQALFRLHGYSIREVFNNPIANTVMQQLIDGGYLFNRDTATTTPQKSLSEVLCVKSYVIQAYGEKLDDDELFATLEMIDTLSFLIDAQDGLNLPIGPVLEFFKRYLQHTAGPHSTSHQF